MSSNRRPRCGLSHGFFLFHIATPHIIDPIWRSFTTGMDLAMSGIQNTPNATWIQSVGRETGATAIIIDLIPFHGPLDVEEYPKILGGMKCATSLAWRPEKQMGRGSWLISGALNKAAWFQACVPYGLPTLKCGGMDEPHRDVGIISS